MGKGTKFRLKHRIDLKQQNPCDIAPLNRETKTRVGTTKAKYKDSSAFLRGKLHFIDGMHRNAP